MSQPDRTGGSRGESRWPMALAVIAVGILQELLPTNFRASPELFYIFPLVLLVFLAVLIVGDPGRIDRDRRWLRITSGCMVAFMTFGTAAATARLVVGILTNAQFASAAELLTIGAIVWITNVVVFALWYWDLDAGGAVARFHGRTDVRPSFVFPESAVPELVAPEWYPHFVDYLAVSFNTSLAFSPADVSPIRRWAKFLMILQSMISLALAALVLARAINIL
jgi:hypothetical protein